jgi:hypothetical protein
MESEANNPYRSPRDDGAPERSAKQERRESGLDRIGLAILQAGTFLFSLLCFTFFAIGALDAVGPRSFIQERAYAHPQRPLGQRIAGCATLSMMAFPFLAIMGWLLWKWSKRAWQLRAERPPNAFAVGVDDVGPNPRTSEAS